MGLFFLGPFILLSIESKTADWVGIALIVIHYPSYVLLTSKIAYSDFYDSLLAAATKYATGQFVLSLPFLPVVLYVHFWQMLIGTRRR